MTGQGLVQNTAPSKQSGDLELGLLLPQSLLCAMKSSTWSGHGGHNGIHTSHLLQPLSSPTSVGRCPGVSLGPHHMGPLCQI